MKSSTQRAFETFDATHQQRPRALDAPHQPLQVWFTAREAAEYLRFPTTKAFYEFCRRHGKAKTYLGGSLRFTRTDLDHFMVTHRPTLPTPLSAVVTHRG